MLEAEQQIQVKEKEEPKTDVEIRNFFAMRTLSLLNKETTECSEELQE